MECNVARLEKIAILSSFLLRNLNVIISKVIRRVCGNGKMDNSAFELHRETYNNTRIYDHNGAFVKEVFSHVSLYRQAIYFPSRNKRRLSFTSVHRPLYRSLLTSDRCGDPSLRSRRSSPSSISSLLPNDLSS